MYAVVGCSPEHQAVLCHWFPVRGARGTGIGGGRQGSASWGEGETKIGKVGTYSASYLTRLNDRVVEDRLKGQLGGQGLWTYNGHLGHLQLRNTLGWKQGFSWCYGLLFLFPCQFLRNKTGAKSGPWKTHYPGWYCVLWHPIQQPKSGTGHHCSTWLKSSNFSGLRGSTCKKQQVG